MLSENFLNSLLKIILNKIVGKQYNLILEHLIALSYLTWRQLVYDFQCISQWLLLSAWERSTFLLPSHIMSVSSCWICSATFIYWDTGKLDEPRRVRAQSGWFRVGGGVRQWGGGRKKKRSLRRKTIYLRAVTMVHMSYVLLFLSGRDRYIEACPGREDGGR